MRAYQILCKVGGLKIEYRGVWGACPPTSWRQSGGGMGKQRESCAKGTGRKLVYKEWDNPWEREAREPFA